MSGYASLSYLADPAADPIPVYCGYIASVVAVVLFGSNFIPVKKFETGDGNYGVFGSEQLIIIAKVIKCLNGK